MNDWYAEMVSAIDSLRWLVVDSVNASTQQLDAFHRCLSKLVCRSQHMLKTCTQTSKLSPGFQELSDKAERILLWPPRKNLSLSKVRHYYCDVDREEWKMDTVVDIVDFVPGTHIVVLCRSRRVADHITTEIARRDFEAVAIHDGMTFEGRNLAVARIRHSRRGVIVCADMWDAGLDGGAAWHWGSPIVINWDIPGSGIAGLDTYRNRTGVPDDMPIANLRQCCCINFVTRGEAQTLRTIEQHFQIAIEDMPMDVFEQLGLV
jgi:superfamily II DNA/RNA helicase